MADERKIDLWVRVWDLFVTVDEGITYLAGHPDHIETRSAVQAGVRALSSCLDHNLLGRLETLLASDSLDGAALLEEAKQLARLISERVSLALSEEIRSDKYITKPTAEKIFLFYDRTSHSSAAVYQLLVDVCAKSSLSAPREAFEYTIKLFEEQPAILSSDKGHHPGYIYKPSAQRTFEKCPICGGEGVPYYRSFSYFMADFHHPYLPVKLWQECTSCGNYYTWKHPEELLSRSAHQEMVLPNLDKYPTAVGTVHALWVWSDVLSMLRKYSAGKSLLEVGIGEGELLAVALELGYDADAVEISTETAQKVSDMLNISIWNGDFLNYAPGKTYSVIIMGDVIEHVVDPAQALRNAWQLLDERGVLWLSTPNFESSFSRMRKYEDPMWMEPGHITYFSYRGLEKLSYECGFTVKEYAVSRRYNGSMELVLTKHSEFRRTNIHV